MTIHGLRADDWLEVGFRILLATLGGGAIGLERELRNKPAGLRTHILVSVGVTLFIMVPLVLSPDGAEPTSRVIQGIAAGIGFLGAGEILRVPSPTDGSDRVQGLTSAAAIWVAAAIGAAAGCGLWQLVLLGTVTTLVVLTLVWRVETLIAARMRTAGKRLIVDGEAPPRK
jgi:putative Mg2+ transporter-C (MgtC) family protein